MPAYNNPRSIIHTIPSFRYAVLFLLGIVLGDKCGELLGLKEWMYMLIISMTCTLLSQKFSFRLCNIAFLLSIVLFGGIWKSLADEERISINREITVECKMMVLSEPIARGKVVQFDSKVLNDGAIYKSKEGNVYINHRLAKAKLRTSLLRDTITGKYKSIHIGDALIARVDLSPLEGWYRQNAHFNYVRWLRARDFAGRGFIGIGKWEKTNMSWNDIDMFEYVRTKILGYRENILKEIKKSGIDNEAFAVATAMALGNKSALTPELRDEYTIAGAAHILALSGVHLTIIYLIFSYLLGKTRKRERISVLVSIWGYVLFVGMPISVVRASCMLTIWETISMLEGSQPQLNVFGATLLAMAAINPYCLWDVGFQMSFMAVFAIITFMEPINSLMPKKWKPMNRKQEKLLPKAERRKRKLCRTLWYIGSASCAAQIGTAPLTAYYFGRLSTLFLATNYIVIPLSWIIICGTLVIAFVAWMNIMVGGWLIIILQVAGWCLSIIVKVQNYLLTLIAHIPMASIGNININAIQVMAVYAIIGAVAVWVNRKIFKE